MTDNEPPKFLHLGPAKPGEVVKFMKVIRRLDLTKETQLKMWELAQMRPEKRLALNCMATLRLCSEKEVTVVITDGITEEERRVLKDLEGSGMWRTTLKVAHRLMNLKERWFLVNSMKRSFKRSRESDNFINLERKDENNGDTDKQ